MSFYFSIRSSGRHLYFRRFRTDPHKPAKPNGITEVFDVIRTTKTGFCRTNTESVCGLLRPRACQPQSRSTVMAFEAPARPFKARFRTMTKRRINARIPAGHSDFGSSNHCPILADQVILLCMFHWPINDRIQACSKLHQRLRFQRGPA